MKITAYISIFSMLLSSFSYAGSNASARLLRSVGQGTPKTRSAQLPVVPEKKWGKKAEYNLEKTVDWNSKKVANSAQSESEGSGKSEGNSPSDISSRGLAGGLSPFPNGKSSIPLSNLSGGANSNKGNGSGSGANDDPGRTPPPKGGSDGEPPPENNLKELPYWLPVCFFFDSHFSEDYARQAIKQVVDDYAYCGVAIKVHSKTLRAGSYNPDDPMAQQAASAYHCNAKEYYTGNDVKFQAGQSYPNSEQASDRLCDDEGTIKQKERTKQWNVAGCAQQPGEFSVVDRAGSGKGAGGVGTHELGHNVGRPGRGGDELENEGGGGGTGGGEGKGFTGKAKTKAGVGLQGKNTPETNEIVKEHDEGSHGGGDKFTEFGCASVRGGANENSERKVKYDPNAFETYYRLETNPEQQLVFQPTGKKFLPGRNEGVSTGDGQKPPMTGDPRTPRTSGEGGDPFKSADPGHKKGSNIAGNSSKGGGRSSSGTRISGGSSSSPSEGTPTSRGDNSSSGSGSAVGGGTGGPGDANSTIVGNRDAPGENNMSGSQDPSFFTSSKSTGSDSASGTSSTFSGSSSFSSSSGDSQSGYIVKASGSPESKLDGDFFTKPEKPPAIAKTKAPREMGKRGYDEAPSAPVNRVPAATDSLSSSVRKPRQGGG